jgi:hypothetical protein
MRTVEILIKIKALTQDGLTRTQIINNLSLESQEPIENNKDLSVISEIKELIVTNQAQTLSINQLITELKEIREDNQKIKNSFFFVQSQLNHIQKPFFERLGLWFFGKKNKN